MVARRQRLHPPSPAAPLTGLRLHIRLVVGLVLGLRLRLRARRAQPPARLHEVALVRIPVEAASLGLVRLEPTAAKATPAKATAAAVASIRRDGLARPSAVPDPVGPWPAWLLDGYAEVRVHHPRSPGRRTSSVILVLVLVAGVPTEEIVYGIGARHTRSRLHDVHHRLPPRAALGQLLAVRYGRGGSVLDGGSVLVLAVAMDLTQVMRWAARTSLVVIRGPRAGVRGHHRSTQRPAEKLKDLVHQLLRRAALHGAHLLPLSRPNVPGFLLEELHELAPVVALLGDARCRRVEAVQGDIIGVVPGYDLGEHVAVRQVPGASNGVEGRVSTRSNFRDACQKKKARLGRTRGGSRTSWRS